MRKFIGDVATVIAFVCIAVIMLGAVFATPRVMAPDSLQRVQWNGITMEEAQIGLVVSQATLNDSQSGVNYVMQYKTLAETAKTWAMAFYTLAIGAMCLSVPIGLFLILTRGFSSAVMYGGRG